MLIILVAMILLGQLPEDCPPLWGRSPGKFCPDDHYAPCQGTSIRRIGQAPPTIGETEQCLTFGLSSSLLQHRFSRVESPGGSPGVVHERTSWRVDGGFPEGKLAGVALQGLSRSPNRVADKRRLVVSGIITALLHCRICSRTGGSDGVPRPPPQHPTSVPFI